MPQNNIMGIIRRIRRPVFTTRELSALSRKSLSSTTQGLETLVRQGLVVKLRRGLWGDAGNDRLSAYAIVPFLSPGHRAYVSFLSALHLHGLVEQIPRVVTVASTAHTKTVVTSLGTFHVHRIVPSFFKGFDRHGRNGDFLIASPEKALVDCLYLSAHRKNQYGHFPELHFPRSFSFRRAKAWAKAIPSLRARKMVLDELNRLDPCFRRLQ